MSRPFTWTVSCDAQICDVMSLNGASFLQDHAIYHTTPRPCPGRVIMFFPVVCILTRCHARPSLVCAGTANSSYPVCPGESLRERGDTIVAWETLTTHSLMSATPCGRGSLAGSCHGRRGARRAERCLRMSGSAPRRKQSTCLPKKRLPGVKKRRSRSESETNVDLRHLRFGKPNSSGTRSTRSQGSMEEMSSAAEFEETSEPCSPRWHKGSASPI